MFAASQTTSSVRRGWLLPLSAQCWVQHTQHTSAEQAEQTDTHTHAPVAHSDFPPRFPFPAKTTRISLLCLRVLRGKIKLLVRSIRDRFGIGAFRLSRFPPPGGPSRLLKKGIVLLLLLPHSFCDTPERAGLIMWSCRQPCSKPGRREHAASD